MKRKRAFLRVEMKDRIWENTSGFRVLVVLVEVVIPHHCQPKNGVV